MLLWIIAGTAAAAVALAAVRHRRPLLRVAMSALGGCCALGFINVFSAWTGVSIALNYATAFVTGVLGVPGVVLLLALYPLIG